jgi:hypothetical protein
VTEGEKTRLIAWGAELRVVHWRLRDALRVTWEAASGEPSAGPPPRERLLFCHGFCTALTGHHQGEDRELFPAIVTAHPELAPTLQTLEQDHVLIARLIDDLQATSQGRLPREVVEAHLARIAAIMEPQFQYGERQLLTVLEILALDADPHDVLGPL